MSHHIYDVKDYGAIGDGVTMNTVAIQKAVDACAAAGGGKVVVPAGVFMSGPIHLKSHIEFHLSAGAIVRGSANRADYPPQDMESHGYRFNEWLASLVTGYKLENVSITGRGVLDGHGKPWWGEIDAGRGGQRPVTIYLCDCDRVLIEGVTVMNSPAWTVLPLLCRNVTIRDIAIKNPWKPYHNCDGMDIYSCRNVHITGCHVDTGDDGICLKSLPDFFVSSCGAKTVDYSKPRIPCENVIIDACHMEHAHSGVGIWAEVIGGMRNVAVSNCVFDGTRTGIRINRYPQPGGYVKDVRIDNIIMRRVESVFEVSSYFDVAKMEEGPDRETTPVFENIHISNVTATQARFACEMYGLPDMPVRNVSFSNISIEADKGFDIRNAENITLDNVTVTCPGPAVMARDARNLELHRMTAAAPQAGIPAIQLANTHDTWIHGCKAVAGTGMFLGLVGTDNRDILLQENHLSPAAQIQGETQPVADWSHCSCAYSGSSMWRKSGDINPFLPVPPAVMDAIRRELSADKIHCLVGIHRIESGARRGLELPAGDRRRMYITEDWNSPIKLVIAEDGELLRKIDDPAWRVYGKE